MICPLCRADEHGYCPELVRQAEFVFGRPQLSAELQSIAIDTGQLCDCQHEPRRDGS